MEKKQFFYDMKNLIHKLWKELQSIRDIAKTVKKPLTVNTLIVSDLYKFNFF